MTSNYVTENVKLLHGDCLEVLKELPDNSVDSVVADPPYGLAFMGKKWDYDVPSVEVWRECLRVLKPGGHLLSFAGSRTYHRMTVAIEDAGFEIRDQIMWVYGCLDEQTEVATSDGVKPYHQTKAGDTVLCYNPDNGEYSYQPILEVVEYDYSDTAYRLVGDFGEQVVSRNHRCIVEQDGREVFVLAEQAARQQQVFVPVLESLSELRQAISDTQQNASEAEQDLQQGVLKGTDRRGKLWEDANGRAQGGDDSLCGLRNSGLEAGCLATEGECADLQQGVQRKAACSGIGGSLSQRAGELEARVGGCSQGKDDGRNQPIVEGRPNLPQSQGGLRKPTNQVRSVSAAYAEYGSQGRVCNGVQAGCGAGDWSPTDALGVCPPYQPQRDGQQSGKPDAVLYECTAQGVRAWSGHNTAMVRVVPFHYTGKVWCLRVPTGAFVAVRNGVAFPTGNSGFPKNLDVSKAIDKAAGAEREKVRVAAPATSAGSLVGSQDGDRPWRQEAIERGYHEKDGDEPATEAARQWQGWGTALKPSHEPVCVARKPLIGTVAANVLAWGTGALNIDGCRVGADGGAKWVPQGDKGDEGQFGGGIKDGGIALVPGLGRWPANLIHSGEPEVVAGFPVTKSGNVKPYERENRGGWAGPTPEKSIFEREGDTGSAARFFYCAKASKKDRNDGCQGVMTWENVDLQSAQMAVQQLQKATSDISTLLRADCEWSTTLSGNEQTARFLPAIKCIIEMVTKQTTHSATSNCSVPLNTNDFIRAAIETMKACGGSPADFAEYTNPSKLNTTCEKTASAAAAVHAVFKMLCDANESAKVGNVHSTVKPTDLMRYLCRLVTPPGGVVLDPFLGSGSTGVAALAEGFRFIGIEREAEYMAIATARIRKAAEAQ